MSRSRELRMRAWSGGVLLRAVTPVGQAQALLDADDLEGAKQLLGRVRVQDDRDVFWRGRAEELRARLGVGPLPTSEDLADEAGPGADDDFDF